MRALVISDTHFGAWTGEDILRDPENLALLAPHLDVDEVILLGDLFDLLFASSRDAFAAAGGLFDLLRERLQGKRFVFLAGNHDHYFVERGREELVELELADGATAEQPRSLVGTDTFRRLLERRLDGVEVDVRYPVYMVGGVLCTHGHYLDYYAARDGGAPGRLLQKLIWSIAVGRSSQEPTSEDFEATTEILTGLLFTIAQLPNGTRAQRRAFAEFNALEKAFRTGYAPVRGFERAAGRLGERLAQFKTAPRAMRDRLATAQQAQAAAYDTAMASEMERRRRIGAPGGGELARRALGQVVRPRDSYQSAVVAFEQVVIRLGWARDTDKIVFAHTHHPLDDVRGPSGAIRYWNTGSWIYEPDFATHAAYVSYLENAWPGTAVLIDTDEPAPRLLRLREQFNPLHATAPTAG
ncbi:MAG TPA: metallophosphoesterase [Solirubrobacteraceae bacterium]|nr:metallophosphoesterase [Solirubrobacteraceae bacterium]